MNSEEKFKLDRSSLFNKIDSCRREQETVLGLRQGDSRTELDGGWPMIPPVTHVWMYKEQKLKVRIENTRDWIPVVSVFASGTPETPAIIVKDESAVEAVLDILRTKMGLLAQIS